MTEPELIYTVDRPSWPRMLKLIRFYWPALRTQAWLYPLAVAGMMTAVVGLCSAVGVAWGGFPSFLSAMTGMMVYFGPAVLTRRPYRDVSSQLPVTAKEKLGFLLLYGWVWLFALVAAGVLLGYCATAWWPSEVARQMMSAVEMSGRLMQPPLVTGAIMAALAIQTVGMTGLVARGDNRGTKVMVRALLAFVVYLLLSGLAGFAVGVYMGFTGQPEAPAPDVLVAWVSRCVGLGTTIFAPLVILAALIYLYRRLRNCGF